MTTRVLPLLAASVLVAACASTPVVLESDVPLPPGMSTVRSADIKRAGGTVTGGTFLLAGEVVDARDTISALAARFRDEGWVVLVRESGLDFATCVATKGGRSVEVRIDRRALDPAMSSGMLVVKSAARGG
ncbi:MAG: hypothetical protein ACO3QC_05420 [Phycisphaerales bacterium]